MDLAAELATDRRHLSSNFFWRRLTRFHELLPSGYERRYCRVLAGITSESEFIMRRPREWAIR